MKKILSIIIIACISLSCAQIIPPTGGPTDKTPPEVIAFNPKNQQTNFKGKTLTLEFNELIDANSLKQELVISPEKKSSFEVKTLGKIVKLIFFDDFEPNTTYTLNFRNGIKDLTEKNPTKNLKYVLSTGSKLDSLQLLGTITDIHTKKPMIDALVALYVPNDTLNIHKTKPKYFTKTDSTGKYQFENLKNDKYLLFAYSDKNTNITYDEKTEYFAFYKDTINLTKNFNVDNLELYKANYNKTKIKKVSSKENIVTINLDKNIKSAQMISNKDFAYKVNLATITVFNTQNIAPSDTILSKFIVSDSLNNTDTLSTKIYFQPKSKTKKLQKLEMFSNIKNNQELTNNISYKIFFDYPIAKFDTSKIKFKTDTSFTEKPVYSFSNHNLDFNINLKTKAKNTIELSIPSNTFVNFKGDTNSIFNLKNNIIQNNKLSSIDGFVKNNKENKIAQLLNADNLSVIQEQSFTDKFYFKEIIPNFYLIKIIFDDNKNGIWDAGRLSTHTQPEKILILPEPIKLRENFEIKNLEIK